MVADDSNSDRTKSFVALTNNTKVGHYRIIKKIGAGGMGEVYVAEDTELKRQVALKFLPPHMCQDEDCRVRFKPEAQAAAKLKHHNIACIHEAGEYSGHPFYSMQVVEGQSLREVIAGKDLPIEQILEIAIQVEVIAGKDLPIEQILEIAIQVCEGLKAASGNFEKAEIYLEVWWESMQDRNQSDSAWYWYSSGCIAFYRGDSETSVQHLRTAADGVLPTPDGSWVHDRTQLMLARTYLESGRLDAAVSEYEGLLSTYTWGRIYSPIWGVKTPYYLSQAYEQSGHHDRAVEQYETFLDIWKDADPGLESVDDAKERLARLRSSL